MQKRSSRIAFHRHFHHADRFVNGDEQIVGIPEAGAEEIRRPVRPLVQRKRHLGALVYLPRIAEPGVPS